MVAIAFFFVWFVVRSPSPQRRFTVVPGGAGDAYSI